jgi:tetratricopeptide (TPR) repeat protein
MAQVPSEADIDREVLRQAEAVKAEMAARRAEEDSPGAVEALLQEYQGKLQQDRKDVATRFYYGNLLLMLNRIDDARVQFSTVQAEAPECTAAYHRMATIYKRKELIKDAIGELERALEIDPDYVEANKLLAEIYINVYDDSAQAEPLLLKVLEVRPDSRSAHYRLGKIAFDRATQKRKDGDSGGAMGQLQEAVRRFKEVVKVSPDAVDILAGKTWFYLGHSYLQLQQLDDAYAAFGFAMRVLPPSAEQENARVNRQNLARQLGRDYIWDLAKAGVEQDLASEDPDARLRGAMTLGDHFQRTGSTDVQNRMIQLLDHPYRDLQVRILVARKLGKADLPEDQKKISGDVLTRALANDESMVVRAAAAYGLDALGSRDRIPALIEAMSTEDSYLFEQVLKALTSLAGTDAPTLRVLTGAPSAKARFEARQQLQGAWRQWWENEGGK